MGYLKSRYDTFSAGHRRVITRIIDTAPRSGPHSPAAAGETMTPFADEPRPWYADLDPEHLDRLRAVEARREADEFASQADYDAAYWAAEGLTPPVDRFRVSVERMGLGALLPLAIDAARLAQLRELAPDFSVHGRALAVLALRRFGGPDSPRWSADHPVVLALATGMLDSAVSAVALQPRQYVTIAPTPRTLDTLRHHPEMLAGRDVTWLALLPEHHDVTLVPEFEIGPPSSDPIMFEAQARDLRVGIAARLTVWDRSRAQAFDQLSRALGE